MKPCTGSAPAESAPSQELQERRTGARRTTDQFGADIQTKPENVLQIGCKNIHGFPNPQSDQVKYEVL